MHHQQELRGGTLTAPPRKEASQTAVYTGSVPMSISGYSWTEEREENYEISDYYYAGENEPELLAAARAEFAESAAAGYSCPIPAEAVPTIPE